MNIASYIVRRSAAMHRFLVRNEKAINLYIVISTALIVSYSTFQISRLQLKSSDLQAEMAANTYKLEIAKNAPDFRLQSEAVASPKFAIQVDLAGGIARPISVEAFARSGSITFHHASTGRVVTCFSWWTPLRKTEDKRNVKEGMIAKFEVETALLEANFAAMQQVIQSNRHEIVSVRKPNTQIQIASMIEYYDVFGTDRSSSIMNYEHVFQEFMDTSLLHVINLTVRPSRPIHQCEDSPQGSGPPLVDITR